MNAPIKKILADFDDKTGPRRVFVLDADASTGTAFVRPVSFNPFRDAAIDYHGFETSFANLHNVTIETENGDIEVLGEPRYRIDAKSPQYLSVQN